MIYTALKNFKIGTEHYVKSLYYADYRLYNKLPKFLKNEKSNGFSEIT